MALGLCSLQRIFPRAEKSGIVQPRDACASIEVPLGALIQKGS